MGIHFNLIHDVNLAAFQENDIDSFSESSDHAGVVCILSDKPQKLSSENMLSILFAAAVVGFYGPGKTQARTEGLVNVDITVSTSKLKETKQFYTEFLKFKVLKEEPGFISFSPGSDVANLDFVVEGAEHACARPQLAKKFAGKGMFLTFNMGDVDAACQEFNKSGYPLAMPLKTEPWFERHCYVIDPNGIPLNLAHWNDTPAEPKGPSSMVFYYTSHNLSEIQTWYNKNLNMTVERGVDWIGWVITLIAANGTVEFRPFQPRNMTYNPASIIPHLLEEFDGYGLSYTFNFNASTDVDRWCQYLEHRQGLVLKRPLGWVGNNRRCAVDDPNGVLINFATPGWNEYEEEVNCPHPTHTVKSVGNEEKAHVITLFSSIAILMSFKIK